MVSPLKINDQKRKNQRLGKIKPICAVILLFGAFIAVQRQNGLVPNTWYELINTGSRSLDQTAGSGATTTRDSVQQTRQQANLAKSLSDLRTDFEKTCNGVDTSKDIDNIRNDLLESLTSIFQPPAVLPKLDQKDSVQPCMYTFIDLGANIGDSLGKFIDAGFPTDCTGLERVNGRAHYDLDKGKMTLYDGNITDLTDTVRNCLKEQSRYPEEYCYVGVEGNPVFTSKLKALEARVRGTMPKPIRSAHFYTETVAAGIDGPTVLYLDTVNTKQNFWGSSVVRTHADVQKSAAENGNAPVEAKVSGLTLTTLMKRSVKREKGAHVVIKIDIEGGEYAVMNEAIETLCDFTTAGVRVDLILELHWEGVLGRQNADFKKFHGKTAKRIEPCNIHRGRLRATLGE